MEHVGMKNSLDSKLQIYLIYSIGIRSRNWDIFKKPSSQIKMKTLGRKTIKLTDVTAYLDSESKYDYLEGALTGKSGCLHGLTK